MVLVGVCLLVIPLAAIAMRSYGDEPAKKPPADNYPFGPPDINAPLKPVDRHKETGKKEHLDSGDDPFGASKAKAADPSNNEPAPEVPDKPAGHVDAVDKAAAPSDAVRPSGEKPKTFAPARLHGGEKAILKALKQETTLEFVETPLKDVVAYVSQKHRIPILLDAAGLKDAGVNPETLVTRQASGIPLQSALEIILDDLQLKWAIHHDVLTITSPQKVESDDFMYTKVYDVTDLVIPLPDTSHIGTPLSAPDAMHLDVQVRGPQRVSQPKSLWGSGPGFGDWLPPVSSHSPVVGMGSTIPPAVAANIGVPVHDVSGTPPATADFKPLMDLIQNTIMTKSWVDNGGNGTMSELPTSLSLAISQTREAHQQIERLLDDLRAQQRNTPHFHVELHWLWLDKVHREALFASDQPSSGNALQAINRQRLLRIAQDVPGFHAIANCLNGMNGFVSAGDRRALIVSAIPVVDGGIAAYQPVVSVPNVGVTAVVAPIRLPGTNSAMITVQTMITRWTPKRGPVVVGAAWAPGTSVRAAASQSPAKAAMPTAPFASPPSLGGGFMQVMGDNPQTAPAGALHAVGNAPTTPSKPAIANAQNGTSNTSHTSVSSHGAGSTSCPIDLPIMPTQELGTTLRVPLGKPVVVGSVIFAPSGDAGVGEAKQDAMEVYLIATTSVVKKETTTQNGRVREARP
jgi:hypothetical protein